MSAEIGPAPAADDRRDAIRFSCGRNQTGRSPGGSAKDTDGELGKPRLVPQPAADADQAPPEERNVEHVVAITLFDGREQIEKDGDESLLVETGGHGSVAWAEPTRARPMGEHNHTRRRVRCGDDSWEPGIGELDLDIAGIHAPSFVAPTRKHQTRWTLSPPRIPRRCRR